MSTGPESFLFDPSGPVNTGIGHQFNGVTFILDPSGQRLVRAGPDPRVVAHEHLCWLHQRFVEPRGYGLARELLASTGSVVLTGAPGSGRRATAQMLLHELPNAQGPIRELPDASELSDSSEEPALDGSTVDRGQRLLLDLLVRNERECRVLLDQLPSYRVVVRQRGAHLAVVLPHSRESHVSLELGPSLVDIERPDGLEVCQRYLRIDGIKISREQLGVHELTKLHSASMTYVAYLAGLVQCAREAEPEQSFTHWLHVALAERSDEVAKQLAVLRSGQQRALLLTAAMFSGAHADAVFAAASELRNIVQHPPDDRPILEREDLAEQFAEIGVTADDAGRVCFTTLAYDRAVLMHFWINFPGLRNSFRKWVETALRHPALNSQDRDTVVTRFAEQALNTGRPDDLRRVAERCAQRTDPRWPSGLLPQAARILERGLNDERHGSFFRRKIYDWSRDLGLSEDLAQVVIQVCSQVLALTHPEQAMVRLHHIVRRHSGAVGAAARDALLDLVNRNRHLYRRLLDRTTNSPIVPQDTAADLYLFLELADPIRLIDAADRTQPLIADAAVRDQLVIGWRSVLDALSTSHCAPHVQTWLIASQNNEYREHLLDVLVRAGNCRDELLSRLYVIARNWAYRPDHQGGRREVAALLNIKIDTAQGIDFTDLGLGYRNEGTSP